MNTRYTLFDSPLLLGFDHLERMIDRATKSSQSGYPPYNIEQISEHGLRITLAVAGFTMDQLSVAIEDKHLVIRGRQDDEDETERLFIHRGIATRQFQRVFLLADEIEVKGAHLDNGLLHVDLLRLLPEKKRIVATAPGTKVVVATAFGSMDTAVSALRAGAWDFVTKPFDIDAVAHGLGRAIDHRRLTAEVKRLRQQPGSGGDAWHTLSQSEGLSAVREVMERVATLDSTVLVTGESGTGKELVARALHEQSGRAGLFLPVNCAAVPEALLESELFGHVKGAFTDARENRAGLFVRANGGTLFLDEIGELPLALQPRLLRALQERTVRPVGSDVEVPFDARLICATHRDLELAVREGRFREDLYFRLDVIHLDLPPLRARGADVLGLAQQFVQRFSERMHRGVKGFSPDVARRLLAWTWPGNVRELQNVIERAVALARFDELSADDLPDKMRADVVSVAANVTPEDHSGLVTLEALERQHIARVLASVGDSRTLAARILGIDRKTLYRKLTGG